MHSHGQIPEKEGEKKEFDRSYNWCWKINCSYNQFCSHSDRRRTKILCYCWVISRAATTPRVTRSQKNNRGVSPASRRRFIQFIAQVSHGLFLVWHNVLLSQAMHPMQIGRRGWKRSFGDGSMAARLHACGTLLKCSVWTCNTAERALTKLTHVFFNYSMEYSIG